MASRWNTAVRALPNALARYMATSASRKTSSAFWYCDDPTATPMLALDWTRCPPTSKGSRITSCTRSATRTASADPRTSSSHMVNSSPPCRARVSPSRRQDSSRRPICCRS